MFGIKIAFAWGNTEIVKKLDWLWLQVIILTFLLCIDIGYSLGRLNSWILCSWSSLGLSGHDWFIHIHSLLIRLESTSSLHEVFNSFLFFSSSVESFNLFLHCFVLHYLCMRLIPDWNFSSNPFWSESKFILVSLILIVFFCLILLLLLLFRKSIQLFIFGSSSSNSAFVVCISHDTFREIILCFNFRLECAFLHFFFIKDLLSMSSPGFFISCCS